MTILSKPTLYLQLPIVVWAATFTYCTYLFFKVVSLPSAYYADEAMGYGHIVTIFGNIVVFTVTLIMVSVYPEKQKEFFARLLLMLSNIPVVFLYNSIVIHYNHSL